jgi:polar amino acid transport system substrate-binding protein
MMLRMPTVLAICLLASAPGWAQPLPPLQIHYQARPPYSRSSAEGVVGLLADPLAAALRRAGIAFVWVESPSQRQLSLIQSGQGLDCGLGWFRNAEREAQGKFSRPIYQDRPFMALTRRGDGVVSDQTLAGMLGAGRLALLVKDGYSYGSAVDVVLGQYPVAVRHTSAENLQMVRMIDAGRAGWMIVAPEEAGVLLQQLPEVASRLKLVPIAGMAEGNTRHLYCSRAVPDVVIEQINRALDERH